MLALCMIRGFFMLCSNCLFPWINFYFPLSFLLMISQKLVKFGHSVNVFISYQVMFNSDQKSQNIRPYFNLGEGFGLLKIF